MKTAVLVFALALASSPAGATVWDLDYFIRGDVSQVGVFSDSGVYQLLLTESGGIPIYQLDVNWVFVGMYGEAVLPADFPIIDFPSGYNLALVTPLAESRVSVSEPDTMPLLVMGLTFLLAWVYVLRRRKA